MAMRTLLLLLDTARLLGGGSLGLRHVVWFRFGGLGLFVSFRDGTLDARHDGGCVK